MEMVTLLTPEGSTSIPGSMTGTTAVVDADAFQEATGWAHGPGGWRRGDTGVAGDGGMTDAGVDLVAFAGHAGLPLAMEPSEQVAYLGSSAAQRAAELAGGLFPDVSLPDLDGKPHALSSLVGSKVAVVCWGSWCGCRYDLKVWEQLYRELQGHNFALVSVAFDAYTEAARPWLEIADVTHLALVDAGHALAERLNVLNVPSVVWIDEEGRIVRPNDNQFVTDLYTANHSQDSERGAAALRRWVTTGETGLTAEQVAAYRLPPTAEEQAARAEFALAWWLHERRAQEAADHHFEEAAELAPEDLVIRRSTLALQGIDPEGEKYFQMRLELEDADIPIYRPLPA